MSTITPSSGLGETTGMFCAMCMAKYGNKRLQLGISLMLASIVIGIIPIISNIVYVDAMFAMLGFISAIPSCFLLDVCSELWQDKGTSFQLILVGSSVGAILTPLVMEPFLCHNGSSPVPGTVSATYPNSMTYHGGVLILSNNSCSVEDILMMQDMCLKYSEYTSKTELLPISMCSCVTLQVAKTRTFNETHGYWSRICESNSESNYSSSSITLSTQSQCCTLFNAHYSCLNSYKDDTTFDENNSVLNTTGINETRCTKNDTNVRLGYAVLGVILLPSSFAFFYFWFRRNSKWANEKITESQRQDYDELGPPTCSKLFKIVFHALLFLSYLPLTSVTVLFATYLTTFGVQGGHKMAKSTMVFMTSAFWLSTLVGRLMSTTLTPLFGNRTIIVAKFEGLILSVLFLMIMAPYSAVVLWVCTILFGIFSCPYEGAGIAYAADYVGMSSRLVAVSWIAVSTRNLVSLLLGA